MFCSKCGGEVQEGKTFCTHCGAPLVKVEVPKPQAAAAPPAQPAPASAPAREAPAEVTPAGAPGGKRWLWLLAAGVGAALLVAAVVLVLVFVVFKSSGPSATVASFFKAVESGNADAVAKTIDTSFFKDDEEMEKVFKEEILGTMPEGAKFEGLRYETDTTGGRTVVRVTSGTMSYSEDGKRQTLDMTKLSNGNRFDMVEVNGAWLISPTTFGGVFASAFKEQANAIFNNEIEPKAGELEKAFTDLGSSMSADTLPSAQELKGQLNSAKKLLEEYRSLGKKARVKFKKMQNLSGSGLENYKAYAEVGKEFIDTSLKMFDESTKFLDYVIGVLARREAGTMPDLEEYNRKTEEYTRLAAELEQRLSEYQEKMESLNEKLK